MKSKEGKGTGTDALISGPTQVPMGVAVSGLKLKVPLPLWPLSGVYPKVCLLSISGSGNSFEHLLWARWCYPLYGWASPVCFLLGPCFMSLVSLLLLCYRSNFPWVKLFLTLLSLNLGFVVFFFSYAFG